MKNGYGFNPKNLNALVEKSGCSYAQIEKEAGIPKRSLSRYMRGYLEPNISSAVSLANYFHVSVDCIIGRTEMLRTEAALSVDEMRAGAKLALVGAVEVMKYRRDRAIIELGKMLEKANDICELLGVDRDC